MTTLRRHRFILNLFLTALMCLWQIGQPLLAANINWTAGSAANFNWQDPANWDAELPTINDDVFFPAPFPLAGSSITLNSLSSANLLTIKDNYVFNAGSLTLGAGGLYVDFAKTLTLNSSLEGSAGFMKTGGGTVRLGSAVNGYTGITTIANGSVIITNPNQLGADNSEVVITLNNPLLNSVANRGYGGGSLVLDGSALGMNFTRDLSLQGTGPIGDRGAAVLSFGNNTLSGTINSGVAKPGTAGINTRLTSANGTLSITGSLQVIGTAGTTVTSLGAVTTAGANFYNLTGALSGTGTLEKTGAGTLFLNPSSTASFNGILRVGGSAASGQSSVRINSGGVLGNRTATGTGGVLDMNGGVLEVRMDAPDLRVNGGTNANVYFRATSTMFADHAIGSDGKINGTAVFGSSSFEDNITVTLNSRNGYGFTFGAMAVNGGDNPSTFTNNSSGLVTYGGNFWSNTNNTANRLLTFSGNGNSLITGSILGTAAAFDHSVAKSGAGSLTLLGTGSTIDGTYSVQGGALVITDFRSVTNNSGIINIGSGGTAGALIIGTSVAPTAAGLTTSKVINLAGSTGTPSIYANQTGLNPVIFNSNFTATATTSAKTLTLGGTNKADNIINGSIPNAVTGVVSLLKTGPGTWVLAGTNTYTGTTSLSNGTFKIKANGATSTVLSSANAISFVNNNVYAGGILEFVGQAGVNNVQNLGALAVDAGANTLRLTPGLGGTASLVFASAGTVNDAASLNIVGTGPGSTVTMTGLATGFVNRMFFEGSDFAYSQAGLLRAPVYGDGAGGAGSDTGFHTSSTVLKSTDTNEMTGSFATNAMTIDALKIVGSNTLTLNASQLLTIRTGAANTDGYILSTGGAAVITGGTGISVGGTGSLSIRVNEASDTLTLESVMTSGTSGGLTKSGAGTLILKGTNAQTGTVSLNEGTIQLSGVGSTIAGNNVSITMRQGTVLDLNGVTPVNTTNSWNNNGILTNSGIEDVTFTIGGSNGTGTSFGTFEQKENKGVINITKTGSGAQSWLGTSNYTGVTTIGGTALVTVESLADIGSDSAIGRGNAANNAGSLVFNGTSASGLVYAGNIRNGILALGSLSMSTDRLFTLSGSGVTLSSAAATNINNAIVWSNHAAIVHGTNADRTIIFTGTSQGENTFNPQISDSTGFATTVTKTGTGIWKLGNAANTYSGPTTITQGILMATNGQGLSPNSNLIFDGGTLYSQGSFHRNIGTGPGQMQFLAPAANTAQFSGGFLGGDSKLTVTWNDTPVWGSTAGFLDNRNGLMLNGSQARAQGATGSIALSEVELASDFSLGAAAGAAFTGSLTLAQNSANVTLASGTTAGLVVGQTVTGTNIPSGAYIVSINSATTFTMSANTANTSGIAGTYTDGAVLANTLRPIRVDDNGNTGADYATISGDISGSAGTGIRKLGTGTLRMTGANTYDGETNVNQGTLVVTSLGSNGPGTSSVGTTVNANQNSNAVTLGNSGTGGGILQYIGQGETSNRKIRLNSTTGSNQIHSDGVGPLILTNVANDMVAGAKTLFLRGTNAQGNMISSILADNGGTLGVTVDSSATWILAGNNTLSGAINVTGGALGIGHDNAFGIDAGSGYGLLTISNGAVFAYGGDRTINNPITQSATSSTIATFIGDNSITLMGAWSDPSTTSTGRFIRNNIATGKTLTLNGAYIATVGTTSRSIGFDGSGDTILNGIFSTVSNTDFGITYAGTGTLTLGGANSYSGKTTISSGTIILGANNVIPEMGGTTGNSTFDGLNNGLIFNPALGLTATLDMKGWSDTVSSMTAITNGTIVIDNTSSIASSLTFGANNGVVNFGSGTGSYTIQNSGGGALSIYKAGNTAATFSAGMTLTHTGITGVTGGTFTIASPLNGTSGFSVTGAGSILALTGGITNPGAVTSIVVENGGTLNLLDAKGSKFSNLSSLTLGSPGGSMTYLGLNVGDGDVVGDESNTDLLSLTALGTLNLFAGNQITLNLTDAGLNPGETYDLLTGTGFTSGVLANTDWILGAKPGGFSSITLTAENGRVFITTGSLVSGDLYWRGSTGNATWNTLINWSQDKAGAVDATTTPGQGTNVFFVSDSVTGNVETTLEQNFRIKSLTFEPNTLPASTPGSVTINPGAVATSRLDIIPEDSDDGITVPTSGPATVNINTAVKLGSDQTWNITGASTLTVGGALSGSGDLTKAGAGKLILGANADPTYDVGTVTIDGGNLEMQQLGGLGATSNNNVSEIIINSGGAFYYTNAVATTALAPVPHDITLDGGTLSVGGGNHFYGGAITLSSASTINLSDNNSADQTGAARNITLTNTVSGSGRLKVNSLQAVTTNLNQTAGTLTLNTDNSTWTGGLEILGGTVTAANVKALGSGSILGGGSGRIIFATAGGTTFDLTQNITLDASGGILELSADASGTPLSDMTVNLTGVITLGSSNNANNALRISQSSDNFSIINITNSIVLGNDASISYQGSSVRHLEIPAVISDGGNGHSLAINDERGAWTVTSRTVALTGLNTFSGDISLTEGTLQFNTVTNMNGAASSLGQGSAINMFGGTLSFIGDVTSQSTNRPITTTTGVATLSANGTNGASITYNGAINVGPVADGAWLVLSGTAGSVGNINGAITQTGDSADLTVNGGTWNLGTATSRIGDDVTVSGATTILNLESGLLQVRDDFTVTVNATLNLMNTGVLSYNTATLSADSTLRATGGGIINLGADNAIVVTEFDGLRIGVDAAGVGTFNMNTYSQTVTEFILGNRNLDRSGNITGSGTLTVTGNLDLYEGTISANLASTGTTAFEKLGIGTVTLSGNNINLASTGSTVVAEGTLVLDYTTNNNTKIRELSALDMRGGTLVINGNASSQTTQSVGSFTLASGGNNTININPGSGQTATLNLNAITRAAGAGTVRINLPVTGGLVTTTSPNNTATGLLGTGTSAQSTSAAFATIKDASGTWFATANGSNIVGLVSTPKNDISSWITGEHITDETTGFTGSVTEASVNSLRFDAASGSVVNIAPGGQLGIVSGGILVTDQVTAGSPGILGGKVATGAADFVITQDSTRLFTLSADINYTNAVTKTGNGPLRLSGSNDYTGTTQIQGGILQAAGGNAIGDLSSVVLADDRVSTLELLDDETIGRLSGGSNSAGQDTLATVILGSHTLTTGNLTGDVNFDGKIVGTGAIIKVGASFQGFRNINDQFTGQLIVNQGGIQFSSIGALNASSITMNKGTAMDIANTGTTSSTTRILDTTPMILNSVDGAMTGTGGAPRLGITVRNDQNNSRVETIGNLEFNSGASYLSGDANASGTNNARAALAATNFVRSNGATVAVRGRNLGTSTTHNIQFRIGDATNQTSFINAMVGGAGAANTPTLSIVPWALGETHNNAALAVTNMGNSLVTYVSGLGFRPLNLSTEYANFATAGATNNTREALTADLTGLAGRTLNSLVLHKNTDAAGTFNVTGTGAGQTLAVTSGTMLFTQATTAANGSLHGIGLSGFDSGITTAGSEYIIFVQNPSSAATTPLLTATIESPLTSAADITKSGRGALVLTGTNTAGGGTRKTTINEGILEIAGLENIGGDTGELVFAGGTLRLGTGFTDDFATRTVTILQGGATWDTNGNDLSLVGSVGSGVGGLTKTGLGKLTLNTTAAYQGTTTVNAGTLTVGVAQAISTAGLVVTTGGTLEMAANATVSSLTMGLGENAITGAGTLTVNGNATLNQGTIGAILGGSMNLIKQTAAQTVALTNPANTYTGYTHIQNGTLSVPSMSNVGSASYLGNQTGANATIRFGFGTTTGTLAIPADGTGGTTDRPFDLVGTTGGATIDNDGTAALILNGNISSSTYGTKTLTLSGSTTGFNNVLAGTITSGPFGVVAVTKAEAGTWELKGTQSYTGTTSVIGGTLVVTGTVNNSPGSTSVGASAATNGLMRIDTEGSYSSSSYSIGTNATGAGSLLIKQGTVEATSASTSAGISVGTAGYGAFQIDGGSFTANRVSLYNSATGTGVLRVNGGTLTSNEYIILSNLRSEFTVTGGTVDHSNASQNIALGYNLGGTSVMNMVGGTVNNTGRDVSFGQTTGTATGILNLVGGTLTTNAFTVGATTASATINFNGGTLKAAIDTAAFIPASSALKAYVYSGNAIFDTAGRYVTVSTPLLAPTGDGVSGLTVGAGGSGYFGAPYVEITGGGGTGATGYAVVDLDDSSPTYGQVTSVVMTNPGIGYTSTPTITLVGGGGTGAAVTASGIAPNASGGLIKNGPGALTLAGGVNTFNGPVVINGGFLSVGATSLPNITALTVGTDLGAGSFNLYQDGVAADLNLPANVSIILGSNSNSGELGFNLGAPGVSDRIVISGTGTLTINEGNGYIAGTPLSGFGVGTYTLITSANPIVGLEYLKLGSLPSGYQYSLSTTANTVQLNVLSMVAGTNLYWTGAVNSSWGGLDGTASNWSEFPGGTPDAGFGPGPTHTVHFSAVDSVTPPFSTTLDAPISILGLRVNPEAGPVTIAPGFGGTLTVGEGGIDIASGAPALTTISAPVVLGASQFWTVADAGSTLSISGVISGSGNLTKNGAGTVVTSGINTFTGNVTLNAGTLRVETEGTSGLGTGASALFLNGGELQIASSTARAHARNTTIAGDVTISTQRLTAGAGVTHTLGTLSMGAHTLNVTSAVSTSGNQGLAFGAATITGSTVFNVVNNGLGATTLLTVTSLSESPAASGYGFTKNGNGTMIISDAGNYTGVVTLNEGVLRTSFNGTSGLGVGAATLVLNGGELQLFNSTGRAYARPTTVGGNVTITLNRNSGGAGVTHSLGTLAIASQTVTVQSGTNATSGNMGLNFGVSTLSGSPTFLVTNSTAGATTVLTLGALSDGGVARTLTKQGNGTMTLTTAAAGLIDGTQVNIEGGRLNSNNATALGSLANVTVSSGATFGVGATQTLGALNGAGSLEINAGLNLTVGSTNNLDSAFSGVIATTTAGLTKAGTGVFAMSGNNLYTGDTAVNAGTLLVNNTAGSGTGGGNVTVAAAATLGGVGSISGGVTLAADATLSPGSINMGVSTLGQLTVGTLTADTTSSVFLQLGLPSLSDAANVALYENSTPPAPVLEAWTSAYQAGTTQHDQVFIENMSGSSVNAVINVTLADGYSDLAYGDVFHLVDWSTLGTTSFSGTPAALNLPTLTGSLNWNTTLFNSHGIVFVMIPEPSRMLLLFLGLMGLFFRRRRH
ncbi:autotransporter-associated beta strand repeat-containing protein [Prosthecobacter sp. SYSU 5D2]|uniref:autotransporter-associated beta strand repeat-containing protein n=1 Tax=Prosthecobacter sp. SYSU 5D2 TaxID=3134134 RepID=UPI0031FE91FC